MSAHSRQRLFFIGLAFLAAAIVLLLLASGRQIQRVAALVEPSGRLLQPPTVTPDLNGEAGSTPIPSPTGEPDVEPVKTPTPSIVLIPTLVDSDSTPLSPIATISPGLITRFPTLPPIAAHTRVPIVLTEVVLPSSSATPVPGATATIDPNTELERIEIVSEFPLAIESGQSEWVRLTLRRSPAGELMATVDSATRPATVVTPEVEIIGTPRVPLASAFGSDYRGCVDATLFGSAFNIESGDLGCISLTQNPIVWTWNITPKNSSFKGEQSLNATLRIVWTHIDDGREIDAQQIPLPAVPITVTAPITNRIQWSAILSSAIGSVFSVPWLHGRWQAFRKRRKKGVAGPILGPLRRQMVRHLNEADLQVLAFDYGILFEDLVGESFSAKTADFLEKAVAKGVLDDLIAQLEEEYPGVEWPLLSPESLP